MNGGIVIQLTEMNNELKRLNGFIKTHNEKTEQTNKNLEAIAIELHHMTIDLSRRVSLLSDEINDLRRIRGDEGI